MTEHLSREVFEISPRFRRSIEDRIKRLERGAEFDEQQLTRLSNEDHVLRQRRLIATQRAEALRMRIFLDSAATRIPEPLTITGRLNSQADAKGYR